MNDNWYEVKIPNDFKPILENDKQQFYIIVSKHGLIRCAYPYRVNVDGDGNIIQIAFDCCTGANGFIYTNYTDIIAFKPVDIPSNVIDNVTDHKKV